MNDLKDYLDPVSIDKPASLFIPEESQFSRNLMVNTENNPITSLRGFRIVIIGLPDGLTGPVPGSDRAADTIRRALYPLARIPGKAKIADLGNMKAGMTFNDTLAGLTHILSCLAGYGPEVILLGGSTALLRAIDSHFRASETGYNLTVVDSVIDYSPGKKDEYSSNTLAPLFRSSESNMKHFVNIGYQTYLNDPQVITRLNRRQYDLIRLGEMRQAIHLTEPCFRDTGVVVFNMGAVRNADAPGTVRCSPNGLYAEEACQLARFAGLSDKLKIFCLFEINPLRDVTGQTAALAAQIIWLLLESTMQKQVENPGSGSIPEGRFVRYHINAGNPEEEMIFIKSSYTDRWWMEIGSASGGKHYVACSYEDYLRANNNDIPDRWIRAISRLRNS